MGSLDHRINAKAMYQVGNKILAVIRPYGMKLHTCQCIRGCVLSAKKNTIRGQWLYGVKIDDSDDSILLCESEIVGLLPTKQTKYQLGQEVYYYLGRGDPDIVMPGSVGYGYIESLFETHALPEQCYMVFDYTNGLTFPAKESELKLLV